MFCKNFNPRRIRNAMPKETHKKTIRKWPLRGYLLLVALLLFLGVLLRNQGDISSVLVSVKKTFVPVVRVFTTDKSVAVHMETGSDSLATQEEKGDSAHDDVAQKVHEILQALTPKQTAPRNLPEDEEEDQSVHDSATPRAPQQSAPLMSCALSSDFSRAFLGGDFKALRVLMAQGCGGVSSHAQAEAIDELVQNGPGTYFKLIKLHQQKRLMIHKLTNRHERFAGAYITIRSNDDAHRADPVGQALEKLDFAEAKKQLIQLLDRKHADAKELAPLLTKIDAYATFYSFVARNCHPTTAGKGE